LTSDEDKLTEVVLRENSMKKGEMCGREEKERGRERQKKKENLTKRGQMCRRKRENGERKRKKRGGGKQTNN
jgi:hypothetical protein